MHKVLFYPYDYKSNIYVKFVEFLKQVDQMYLMSFPGSGLIGKDAGIVDKTRDTGIVIQSDKEWEGVLDQVDTIYFLDSSFQVDNEKQILPKIEDALQKNKKIVCDISLSESDRQKIAGCRNGQNSFEYKGDETIHISIPDSGETAAKTEIYKFTTPVIMVFGLTERTNKRIVQLSLKRELERNGFRVSCILSSGCGERFGAHSYPDWMFDGRKGEVSKIVAFNQYVKEIEQKESPDLIVIGVPGAIFPYNNHFTNYFGIQAFLAARAAEPDGVICCSNYIDFTESFFSHIKNVVSAAFSTEVLGFALNNMVYDSRTTISNDLKYTSIGTEQIASVVKELNSGEIPLWNIMEPADMEKMGKNVIENYSASEHIVLV